MNILISRALLTAGATGGALLLGAGVASAHVGVSAPGAEQGGYTVLTFKVPTESETAGTTKLTVTLPDLKSARTEPMPGWTSQVVKDPASGAPPRSPGPPTPASVSDPASSSSSCCPRDRCRSRTRCPSPPRRPTATARSSNWDQQPGPDGASPTSRRPP